MKMFLSYAESLAYLIDLAGASARLRGVSLFVLPSFPVLAAARELLAGTGIAHGAQDCHWTDAGPHTGSVSPAMLDELGCAYVEVGHAERRRDFGEDDAMVAGKAAAAVRCGLVPIVCVGEQREGSDAVGVVQRQVDAVLAGLPDDADVVIAYEPVWAIGAPRPAGSAHVERLTRAVRAVGAGRTVSPTVLYGGGVTPAEVPATLAAGPDGIFASRSMLSVAKLESVVAGIVPPE